jgi:hypothetical protein
MRALSQSDLTDLLEWLPTAGSVKTVAGGDANAAGADRGGATTAVGQVVSRPVVDQRSRCAFPTWANRAERVRNYTALRDVIVGHALSAHSNVQPAALRASQATTDQRRRRSECGQRYLHMQGPRMQGLVDLRRPRHRNRGVPRAASRTRHLPQLQRNGPPEGRRRPQARKGDLRERVGPRQDAEFLG